MAICTVILTPITPLIPDKITTLLLSLLDTGLGEFIPIIIQVSTIITQANPTDIKLSIPMPNTPALIGKLTHNSNFTLLAMAILIVGKNQQ